ncbi:MAG: Rnase Y domain-containing protein, partial [Ruminiclostridium sp.]|nr:Rnase Y domain-containing protein [Ruminiclostridium sp.]
MKKIKEIIIAIVAGLIGILIGYIIRKKIAEAKIESAEDAANKLISEAKRNAEAKKKEAILEAKEEAHRLRVECERENRDRRNELQRMERRLVQKEETLDRKSESIERKEDNIHKLENELNNQKENLSEIMKRQLSELENISGMSFEQAREILLARVENEIKHETAMMIKDYENQAKEESEKNARKIISLAIQRCAADHVAES